MTAVGSKPPRIAIPLPHFSDPEYAQRAIPQYERAVALAGGEAVRVPLDRSSEEISRIIERCDAVLLPGSKADVDPARFHAARSSHTAAADPRRDVVDNLLLDDAYRLRKPVLGICYGLQSLNVYNAGSLVQHIPDFLPTETRDRVNHEAGGKIAVAHAVEIDAGSKLAGIVGASAGAKARFPFGLFDVALKRRSSTSLRGARLHAGAKDPTAGAKDPAAGAKDPTAGAEAHTEEKGIIAALKALRHPKSNSSTNDSAYGGKIVLPVNSSHHQSADSIGKGLRVVARCTADGIIEALEGTAPDHFVVAVQWHPERSAEEDPASRAIFRALMDAVQLRRQ